MDPAYGRVLIPNQNIYPKTFVTQEAMTRQTTQGRSLRSERMDSTATSYSSRYIFPSTSNTRVEPRGVFIQSVVEKNQRSYNTDSYSNTKRVDNI